MNQLFKEDRKMRTKNEAEKAIETALQIVRKLPDDLTDVEKSYLLGVVEGMNAYRTIHTDEPEKSA